MLSSGFKRLVMRAPRLERFIAVTRAGGIFLLPPAVFWIVFALSAVELWEWPYTIWKSMPVMAQTLGLVLCPILTLASGIVRLRWDRDTPGRIQTAGRHTILGGLFLLLTILAMVRAA